MSEGKVYEEDTTDVDIIIRKQMKKCCFLRNIKEAFPVLEWLPKYKADFIIYDIVAGLTVGLTTVPQAIAYATIAGLQPEYGLYSAFMGCFVYIIFGTSKDITVGPTAIMALMVQQIHIDGNSDYAILCCFLSGCIILCFGFLNLGILVRFISMPVITGFTMAAAITISSGQVSNLFGISCPSNEFWFSWKYFFSHLNESRLNDAILGITTLIILLLLKKLKNVSCCRYQTFIKCISLSQNAVAIVVGILICYLLSGNNKEPFKVSGQITAGLPPLKLPPFSTTVNGTNVDFNTMISNLGISLATIPVIAILESVAIAKAFSKGRIVNATQEMIALGICNISGSFLSSMPVTGSFTRTALNNASGVKTPLGGLFTGILVLLALAFLTNAFYYIPKATLAAIIIAAMIYTIDYERIRNIWRSKILDFIPFTTCAVVGLWWSLEYGIIAGVLINITFILYESANPRIEIIKEKVNNWEIGIVNIKDGLCFSSAEHLKVKVMNFLNTQTKGHIKCIVLQGDNITSIDFTVASNILSLQRDLAASKCQLICWNWNKTAAGVLCRLQSQQVSNFKYSKSINDLINEVELENGVIETHLNAV